MSAKPQLLSGLKILDLATMLAAPMASTLLADFGAEVIKVELPDKEDPLRDLPPHKDGKPLWWKVTNRNKKGITLDIRKPEGRELLLEIIGNFDVLVENFRPGTLEKYGLSPEVLQARHPGLIILRVSGYGQTGPNATSPGFARVAEAFSGFTYLCGYPESGPMHIGFPIADATTGIFGALSIIMACWHKAKHPEAPGEVIDLSLVESMFRLLEFLPIEYDQLGHVRERSGNRSQYAGPSNIYRSKDSKWISLSASAQSIFENFARQIGRHELITDPRFKTNSNRVKHADELDEIVATWFAGKTQSEALEEMKAGGVAGGPVLSIEDIFNSEQFKARDAIIKVNDPELGPVAMQAVTPKYAKMPGSVSRTGPVHGQDTDDVYKSLGISEDRITELKSKRAI
ncbi:CaiB/BaiF CoA transferase family protein [Sneathiella sp. HT1-7]|uniref:CaiB/BaiF CoA transferase family protein n=1 Tax=Sneathiella sp. HT1-7 TaxID=2887192 RepID=UPI001D138FDC|nr:CoA transferase [Sneathiella sp. HT1-7]MCC3304314.1 CoA transferase [Sneathiella sp. HT1-7]